MTKEPNPDILLSIVEPELRKAAALAPEFVSYDRAPGGSYEKSLVLLYEAGRHSVERNRKMMNFEALRPKDKKEKVAAIKTKGKYKGKDEKQRQDPRKGVRQTRRRCNGAMYCMGEFREVWNRRR